MSTSATGPTTAADRTALRVSPVRTGCAHAHTCSPEHRRAVLARSALFGSLPAADRDAVAEILPTQSWEAGQYLHSAGDPASALRIVVTGTVLVEAPSPDGAARAVEILGPGDAVGALAASQPAAAAGPAPLADSARALTTVCALVLGPTELERVVARVPAAAALLLSGLAAGLSRTRGAAGGRGAGSVPTRLAAVLLDLAGRLGERREDGSVLIEAPLSREDLAALAGTTPESASRAMSAWRRSGLIESGRRWTALRDPEGLRALAAA